MKHASVMTISAIVLALSACSAVAGGMAAESVADLPVLVRNSVRSDVTMQALARGRLHLDRHGCLRIGGEDGPFVIWHHDSRIERADDGRIKITDGFTGNSAYVGDEIAMAGGRGNFVPPASSDYKPAMPTNITEPIPEACASGEIWWAGNLMSEAERLELLERERNRQPIPSPAN
jgi:hypothetical protein